MDGAAITVCCKVLINYLWISSVVVSYTFDDVVMLLVCKADVTQASNHTTLIVLAMKQEMTCVDRLECWLM